MRNDLIAEAERRSRDSEDMMRCLTLIIRDSFLRSVFGQFLAETGDDGTLTSYLAINKFFNGYQEAKTGNEPLKLDTIKQLLADAHRLYRAYFSPYSPCGVNVIYHLKGRLMGCFARKRDDEETLNKVATLFDQAQDSIFKQMISDFVPKFMKESKYASLVRLQEKEETREQMTGSGAHPDSSAQSTAKYCYEDDQIRTPSKDNFLIDRGTEMMQTHTTVDKPPVMTGTQSIGCTGSAPEEDKPSPSPEPAALGGSLDDQGHETGAHAIKVDEDLVSSMAKKEVVNRLMGTFYELLGEEMEDSSESESGEDKSDVGSVSTESSDESGILTPSETSDDPEGANNSENTRGHHQTGSNLDPTSVSQKSKGQNDRRSNGGSRRLDEEDEDEHDDSKHPRRAVGKRPVETTLRRFACPFSKRYPGLRPKCSACVYPGFKTTHRVKEHLYRTHMRPVRIVCPRCYTPFENDTSLREHVLAVERCPQAESPPVEGGLDEEQGRLLRYKNRKGAETPEEDKWRKIFQICFPEVLEADIPFPYCDQQHSPHSRELERFEKFERERLPQLVQRAVEQAVMMAPELKLLEEKVGSQLVDIIRTCQDELYEQFRTISESNGEGGRDQHLSQFELSRPPHQSDPFPTGRTEVAQAQDQHSSSAAEFGFDTNNPAFLSPLSVPHSSSEPFGPNGWTTLDDVLQLWPSHSWNHLETTFGSSAQLQDASFPGEVASSLTQDDSTMDRGEFIANLPNDPGEGPAGGVAAAAKASKHKKAGFDHWRFN
ncbi:hypothetical protein SLS58_007840 [Diplodia intermedia]|uniref:RGS domain-containing protein n=1 Tax=Diplodia intermedia TaxID=856260 RepID=A0ABR3TJ22_9PEZI